MKPTCIAVFCLLSFLISLTAYLVTQFAFAECALSKCRSCTINGEGRFEQCNESPERCRYIANVLLESDTDRRGVRAETVCFDCNQHPTESVEQELGQNKELSCVPAKPPQKTRIVSSYARTTPFSQISLVLAIFFAVVFALAMMGMFQSGSLRLYPRFLIAAWMNLRSALHFPRSPSRASTPPGPTSEAFVTPPPPITSRRRISKLIEGSKLSANETKALREDGWSCCICLEETDDEEQTRPVTRLKCNHATHSECLRVWLETGRAACCLCNADVFSDSVKEHSLSSLSSTTSAGDTGLIGSLVVERTDRTPSSPATSVFIDISQPYSDTAPSNDERDGNIESVV